VHFPPSLALTTPLLAAPPTPPWQLSQDEYILYVAKRPDTEAVKDLQGIVRDGASNLLALGDTDGDLHVDRREMMEVRPGWGSAGKDGREAVECRCHGKRKEARRWCEMERL
jgi:hypothetical protein